MPLDCTNCPLKDKRDAMSLPLSKNKPYTIVTKPPTPHDVARGNIVPSSYGKVLDKELSNSGLRLNKDFNVIPSIRCAYDKDIYTSKEKQLISKTCRVNLADTLARLNPTIIVPLGADATSAVRGKKCKITKVRGVPTLNEEFNTLVLPILDPAIVNIRADNAPLFTSDVQSLVRLIDNDCVVNSSSDFEGDYTLIDDIGFIVDANPEILGLDTETMGFNYHYEDKKLLTIQFCYQEGTAYILSWDHPDSILSDRKKAKVIKDLNTLRKNGAQFTAHNSKFDLLWIYKKLGVDLPIHHDTLLLYSLINENSYDKSLATLTKLYIPSMAGYSDVFDLEIDKAHMELVPLNDMLNYACLHYDSLVQVGSGEWVKIGKLVNTKYSGTVVSIQNGVEVAGTVTDWHRQYNSGQKWVVLDILGLSDRQRWGSIRGPRFTPDHEILTDTGYTRIDNILIGTTRISTGLRKPSSDVEQVLYASLLGDGGLTSRWGSGTGYRCSQASNREGYVRWKAEALSSFCEVRVSKTRTGYRAITKYHPYFAEMKQSNLFEQGHAHTKATVTRSLLDKMGALSLAVWYQDDGTLSEGSTPRIYATKMPADQRELVIGWADTYFNIPLTYNENNGFFYPRGLEGRVYFFKAVSPYIHKDCMYKIPDIYRSVVPYILDTSTSEYFAIINGVELVDRDTLSTSKNVRYCITVDTHHNFKTQAGFVKNCGDADAVFRLTNILLDIVWEDQALWNYYERVTIPGINAFKEMEKDGIIVDTDKLHEFRGMLSVKVYDLRASLLNRIPRSIRRKHMEKGLNFTRADFLRDILFNHKDGFKFKPQVFTETTKNLPDKKMRLPSTSTKQHLPYFIPHKFVEDLIEFIKLERMLGTNVISFEKKYIHNEGKIWPSFSMSTAVTGRCSSKNPNSQNFPSRGGLAKPYKEMFKAPTGCGMVAADYSQMELRIAAHEARDKEMIRIYNSGGDIHAATAASSLGLTLEEFYKLPKDDIAKHRFGAKGTNFGYLYSMLSRTYVSYAKTTYGIDVTEKEAEDFRNVYFAKYKQLIPWHKRREKQVHKDKQVRSVFGRVRHLPQIDSDDFFTQLESVRQSINSPVQSAGSDLGVLSLGRITSEIDKRYMYPRFFIHDAIYNYVPSEYMAWGSIALKWYMESNPIQEMFGFEFAVPIVAEPEIGTSQGSLVEVPAPAIALDDITIDDLSYLQDQTEDLEKKGLILPTQKIPPNNGRIFRARRRR